MSSILPLIFCRTDELFDPDCAVLIRKFARTDLNQVDQPADAEDTARQQKQYAGSDLAGHKSVDTESAEKECNQDCPNFAHSDKPPKNFLHKGAVYDISEHLLS